MSQSAAPETVSVALAELVCEMCGRGCWLWRSGRGCPALRPWPRRAKVTHPR
jgi:hypothetical protein